MIFIYRIFFPIFFILLSPYYFKRMLRRGGYGKKIRYRFGLWPNLKSKKKNLKRIWIQAVSVGELSSINTLIDFLIKDSNFEIVLSGTTSTGQMIAERKFSNIALELGPFPIDWYPFSSFCWARIKPDLVICVDSELWPEHMHQAKKKGVPVCIVNARLSDRSFSRLLSLGIFRNLLLPDNLYILASSQKQQERWIKIGSTKEKTTNIGNLKVDIASYNPISEIDKKKIKSELGFPNSSIVLAGISTWPGEEKFLLETFQQIRDKKIDARLLLIPRHVERSDEIIQDLSSSSFSFQQRSKFDKNKDKPLIYLADTTGELTRLIKSADLAFLGKTLPPRHEGQNPFEPISVGLPLVIGPKCTNFSETCDELLDKGAVNRGYSKLEVKNLLIKLAQSFEQREKMRNAGLQWFKEQGSPSEMALKEIKKLFS